jgi:hypothetical protein
MRLGDRIRRWWKPAQWRDDHPEESDGDGRPLDASERSASRLRFWQATDNPTGKFLPIDDD